jgi:acetyltransferase-like isoleucine patch superfamily enzyme
MKNEQLRNHLPNKLLNLLINRYYKLLGLNLHPTAIIYYRSSILRYLKNIVISSNVIVKAGAQICACNKFAKISIGRNTTIGNYTFIYASEKITIGNDCMIAPFVYIVDSDHGKDKNTTMNSQKIKLHLLI